MASMAGTLTTILVFLPLAFISGILGEFIRVLPITITIALIVSLLLSLFVTPIGLRYIYRKRTKRWWLARKLSDCIDWIAAFLGNQYAQLSKRSFRGYFTATVAILISFAFVFLGMGKFSELPFNVFPETKDGDNIQVTTNFPPGTEIQDAIDIARQTDQLVASVIGAEQESIAYYEGSLYGAYAAVELTPYHSRDVSSIEFETQLNKRFADEIVGAEVEALATSVGPPADDFPFKMQIYSEDSAPALVLANEIVEYLEGTTVTRATGKTAEITAARISTPGAVFRAGGDRYIQVEASFDATDVSALTVAAQELVEGEFNTQLADFGFTEEEVEYDFGFESENQDSFSSLLLALPIALIAMYVLLTIQFRSFLQPVLIFLAIPFSMFGVAYGLSYADYGVSFFTMFGFLGLVGIVVNNTILLVDYANQEKRKGLSTTEAITNATKLRLRPLLTTTLTTVSALLPLALSDPFWQPLAITIMFGLLSSTFLVIVSFPFYYLVAYWLRDRTSSLVSKLFRRKNEAKG